MTEPFSLCWRYHATDAPKLIQSQAELDEAEAHGWRDSPGAAAALKIEHPPLNLPRGEPQEAMPDDGVVAVLAAAEEAAHDDPQVEAALEAAEEAIEEVQAVVSKKRSRKAS